MTRRPPRSRAYAPDPAAPGRHCDMPGCGAQGEYRAPKSRAVSQDYWWFCLEHVRAYNASWDFYKGMSPAEIEAATRSDTAWGRPTWPLGSLGARIDASMDADPLHVLNAQRFRSGQHHQASRAPDSPADLRDSLAALGLGWPLTLDELKTRYKQLAKLHHPDANNGSRDAEERLKTINLAYAAIRNRLSVAPMASMGAAAG